MLTLVLQEGAAPQGGVDEYPNVTQVGASSTNSGVQATDQAAYITAATAAVAAGNNAIVKYTDAQGTARQIVVNLARVKSAY